MLRGKITRTVLPGVALLGLLSSSPAEAVSAADLESAKAAVVARDSEWQTVAIEKKDAKKIASYFSTEVISFGSGGPTTRGMDGVTKLAEAYVASNAIVTRATWERVEISASGDMAYFFGIGKETNKGADGKSVTSVGRFVRIWKKESDGVWRCTLESWTT